MRRLSAFLLLAVTCGASAAPPSTVEEATIAQLQTGGGDCLQPHPRRSGAVLLRTGAVRAGRPEERARRPRIRELLETCRRLTGAVPARTEGPMSRVAVRPLAGEQERNGQGGVRALLPISGSTSGIFVELSGCCPRSTIAAHALGVANPDPSSACVNSGFCPPGEADVGAGAHNVTFRRVGRGMGGGFTCAATNGLTWWSSAGRSLISCSQKGES